MTILLAAPQKDYEVSSYEYHFLLLSHILLLHEVQYKKYLFRLNFNNTEELVTVCLIGLCMVSINHQHLSMMVMLALTITQVINFPFS